MNSCGMHVGTSAFTAAGWEGSFYPAGMKPADFLTYYATKFDTVEVDARSIVLSGPLVPLQIRAAILLNRR